MDERRSKWQVFRSWHGQESFWREVYARSFAGIFTAYMVVWIGLAVGAISVHGEAIASSLPQLLGFIAGFIALGSLIGTAMAIFFNQIGADRPAEPAEWGAYGGLVALLFSLPLVFVIRFV
jgi:hypothetical protein